MRRSLISQTWVYQICAVKLGELKTQDLTSRDWKLNVRDAAMENAEPDTGGMNGRGGNEEP